MARLAAKEATEAASTSSSHAAGGAEAASSPGGKGVFRRALGLLGRAIFYSGVAGVAASSYYTYSYDLGEIKEMVKEAKKKSIQDQASGGGGGVNGIWLTVIESYLRARTDIEKQIHVYTDPTCDRLLPDMRPEMRAHGVKTLVLDLNKVLVHKEWSRQKGWSLLKRPGAQEFLSEMAQFYEIVVYTDEPATYANPVLNKLDLGHAINYRLYRPETQYLDGKHVRDLSKLNRDLSQVLFISADPGSWSLQPENALKLKPWKGDDPGDTTLLDLLPMLQMVAMRGVKDVRDVVRAYDGEEDVPRAFKKRMQSVAMGKQQASKAAASPARSLFSLGK